MSRRKGYPMTSYRRFMRNAKKILARMLLSLFTSIVFITIAGMLFISCDAVSGYNSEIAYAEKYKDSYGFDYYSAIDKAENLDKTSAEKLSLYSFCKEHKNIASLLCISFFAIAVFFLYVTYSLGTSLFKIFHSVFSYCDALKRLLEGKYYEDCNFTI